MNNLSRYIFFKGDSFPIVINYNSDYLPTVSGYDVNVLFGSTPSNIEGTIIFQKDLTSGVTAIDSGSGSVITIPILPTDTANISIPEIYFKVKLSQGTDILRTITVGVIEFQTMMGDYFVGRLISFMKDEVQYNTGEFLNTVENDYEHLKMYLGQALQNFNSSFFTTSFSMDDMIKVENILLVGAMLTALTSNGVLSARCALNWTDLGGVVVSDMDRYGRYTSLFTQYFEFWRQTVMEFKRSWNIENSYSSISSDMIWGGFEMNNVFPWRDMGRGVGAGNAIL